MGNSATGKAMWIGALILMLLIPTLFISLTVGERRQRRDLAVKEMQSSWSGSQVVDGPLLRVPVRVPGRDEKNHIVWSTRDLFLLPDALDVQGDLRTETRHRGIYNAVLYTAHLVLRGSFMPPDLEKLDLKDGEIQWDRAVFTVGLSDLRGVKGGGIIEWAGSEIPLDAGAGVSDGEQGLTAAVSGKPFLSAARRAQFALTFDLLGSQSLNFVPVGKTTTVALKSSWTAPAFQGMFLPETRTVDKNGFAARWKILHINRSLPSASVDASPDLAPTRFGLDLLVPVDQYTSVDRAVKYEMLFVFLTFLVFFLVEYSQEKRLHPMQYLLVGAGVVLFYLLLLSFSEHMPLPLAYALAGAAVVAVVAGYAHGVFGRTSATGVVAGFLSCLYGYLYILLRLEDYALLFGSLGLLLSLALVMYFTRRFDWYGLEQEPAQPQ